MSRRSLHRLGDLQLGILKVLWARQNLTVTEVHAALPGGGRLAYTTIATMLRKMEGRGLVAHRVEGRSFLYAARVTEDEVSHGMAEHLVERLFAGSVTDVVSHLLSTREVSRKELAALEKLIAERKKKL
jgi:BlaI family transcriptional regulator, penicillinase repressor